MFVHETCPPRSGHEAQIIHLVPQQELTLPMGEPCRCFENATRAVLKHPNRLLYVEGFILAPAHRLLDGGWYPIYHAWIKDKLTGKCHEITPNIEDPESLVYIGKEFTSDMVPKVDQWRSQLTMADQLELLTGVVGYEIELHAVLNLWEECEVIDPATIDMSVLSEIADYRLTEAKGTEDEPWDFTPETGQQNWHYVWIIRQGGAEGAIA